MNDSEKLIITKLFKIAEKQQKIIHKLAQMQSPTDMTKAYLKRTVDVAATNAGIKVPVGATVSFTPGIQTEDNVKLDGTYTVMVTGMNASNEATKQTFLKVFKDQVHAQKPELDSKVSVLFM
jgi:hypothetical protein